MSDESPSRRYTRLARETSKRVAELRAMQRTTDWCPERFNPTIYMLSARARSYRRRAELSSW